MATLKGQNLRVFIGTAYIAESTNCTITLTGNTEESSTKDDTGLSSKPSVVSKTWQVQVESLNVSDIGTLVTAAKSGTTFNLLWDQAAGNDNRTPQSASFSRTGSAIITDATFTFNDRENSTKNVTFTGTGALQ